MPKRKVFYSFHYNNDVFRVQQIRNMGQGNRTIKTYQTTTVREKTYFAKPAFYNV